MKSKTPKKQAEYHVGPYDLYIGIDCGTETGLAVWSTKEQAFTYLKTVKIHTAIIEVLKLRSTRQSIHVTFEDAREVKFFGKVKTAEADAKRMGAGYVKRDAVIWQDFLYEMNIPFYNARPDKEITKLSDEQFVYNTGYKGNMAKVSKHAKDAGMIAIKQSGQLKTIGVPNYRHPSLPLKSADE